MGILLDGKSSAFKTVDFIRLNNIGRKRKPLLKVILVGNNLASESYVKNKVKLFDLAGAICDVVRFTEEVEQQERVLDLIKTLNEDNTVDGIIVQLPLPKEWDPVLLTNSVAAHKDVDGFRKDSHFTPCTPLGVITLLREYNIDTDGKDIVVIGRSDEVGRPLANILSDKEFNGTVTLCHSHTKSLNDYIERADIIVSAVGKLEFISADMIKENAVCIDIGINRVPDSTKKSGSRLCGDFKIDEALINKCSYYTPTPGGTGPMTVAALLMNTMNAYLCVKGDF